MLKTFAMVDGLDFDAPQWVRLSEIEECQLTRGFNNSPKYQHRPGETWRVVATPRSENDDLGMDKLPGRAWDFTVGEILADTVNEPPELVQILWLRYVGP
jgi:hypothetical protein